jgi:hypothetical protein
LYILCDKKTRIICSRKEIHLIEKWCQLVLSVPGRTVTKSTFIEFRIFLDSSIRKCLPNRTQINPYSDHDHGMRKEPVRVPVHRKKIHKIHIHRNQDLSRFFDQKVSTEPDSDYGQKMSTKTCPNQLLSLCICPFIE